MLLLFCLRFSGKKNPPESGGLKSPFNKTGLKGENETGLAQQVTDEHF